MTLAADITMADPDLPPRAIRAQVEAMRDITNRNGMYDAKAMPAAAYLLGAA